MLVTLSLVRFQDRGFSCCQMSKDKDLVILAMINPSPGDDHSQKIIATNTYSSWKLKHKIQTDWPEILESFWLTNAQFYHTSERKLESVGTVPDCPCWDGASVPALRQPSIWPMVDFNMFHIFETFPHTAIWADASWSGGFEEMVLWCHRLFWEMKEMGCRLVGSCGERLKY